MVEIIYTEKRQRVMYLWQTIDTRSQKIIINFHLQVYVQIHDSFNSPFLQQ